MNIRIISLILLFSYICTSSAGTDKFSFEGYLPKNNQPAEDEGALSGDFAITSNYIWNGISQSNDAPAGQADVIYNYKGFYAGLWGSSTHTDNENGQFARFELDTLFGYHKIFANQIGYELIFDRYNYPSVSHLSYNEYYATAIVKIFHFSTVYSDDEFATGKSGVRFAAGIDYVIPSQFVCNLNDVSVDSEVGYFILPKAAGNSYAYFCAGIAKTFAKIYSLELSWAGTDGQAHQAPFDNNHVYCTARVSF